MRPVQVDQQFAQLPQEADRHRRAVHERTAARFRNHPPQQQPFFIAGRDACIFQHLLQTRFKRRLKRRQPELRRNLAMRFAIADQRRRRTAAGQKLDRADYQRLAGSRRACDDVESAGKLQIELRHQRQISDMK